METKHTKGDWTIGNSEIFRPASSGSISPYYKQICSFVNNGTDECKANAKLIAAAPDLLEALIKLKPLYDGRNNEYEKLINNAIKKATK